jgi:hypothetical protein
LAAAITIWFSAPDIYRPIENLIYGAIRTSSLGVEAEFLALAQAIESFHRLTDDSTIISKPCFRLVVRRVRSFLHASYKDSPIFKRVLDDIAHSNAPSFQNRITGLLARLSSSNVAKLLDDPEQFNQNLRQTRNYFTHPGIRQQPSVITEPGKLFLFNQKLHALLRLLLLVNLGFSEHSVFPIVLHQSQRWQVL